MRTLDESLPGEAREYARKAEALWLRVEQGEVLDDEIERHVVKSDEQSIQGIAHYCRAVLRPTIEGQRQERARLLELLQQNEREERFYRDLLGRMMERRAGVMVRGATVKVIYATKHRIESEPGLDLSMMPDDLVRVTREPNKTAIKERLKSGEKVTGWRMVARKVAEIR